MADFQQEVLDAMREAPKKELTPEEAERIERIWEEAHANAREFAYQLEEGQAQAAREQDAEGMRYKG